MKLYVLPTPQDQSTFRRGEKPARCVVRELPSAAAAESYETGLNSVARLGNGAPADVVVEGPLVMEVCFEPEADSPVKFTFQNTLQKDAFRQGLEDGEGADAPLIFTERDAEFRLLETMYAADTATVFVRCEEGSLTFLRSFGVGVGRYDVLRHGVEVTATRHAIAQIAEFPADFEIEHGVILDGEVEVIDMPQRLRSATLVFLRHEGADVTTVGMLVVKTTLATDALAKAAVVDAVTEWVDKTQKGRALWNGSGADLNIGDLASGDAFADPMLLSALTQRGIAYESCMVADTPAVSFYDEVLVDASRLAQQQSQFSFGVE